MTTSKRCLSALSLGLLLLPLPACSPQSTPVVDLSDPYNLNEVG